MKFKPQLESASPRMVLLLSLVTTLLLIGNMLLVAVIKPIIFSFLISRPFSLEKMDDAVLRTQIASLEGLASYAPFLEDRFFVSSIRQYQGRLITRYYRMGYEPDVLADGMLRSIKLMSRTSAFTSLETGAMLLFLAKIKFCLGKLYEADFYREEASRFGVSEEDFKEIMASTRECHVQ